MLNDGEKGVVIQRDKVTYAIAPHMPCGLVTAAQLRKIADVADRFGAAVKVTSAQRIAIVGLREEQVDAAWAELGMSPAGLTGLCVRSIKVCPGTSFCKRGLQDSLDIGQELDRLYHGLPTPGKMKLGVSGCPNQCGETNFRDIGLVGSAHGWKLLVGGNGGGKARIGECVAEGLTKDQALAAVAKVVAYFVANAKPHERLGRVIERLGIDALKAAL
ncbi:MAG: NAD(P)/FAD-dependent oxidoreductase [Phycisphaerae bacterium]|nr:NAD(P)/FAD-dependent oxidoreductase [Phycisphaerae bacterium]